jgi:4-hydroxy-tetrahydrodipicolinate reductase
MNISLIGYGRMGQVIEDIAQKKGHVIVSRIDPINEKAEFKEISADALQDADVCIEFTQPDAVLENIFRVAELKKNLVVGTTGWFEKTEEVQSVVEKNGIGFVYASNFSIGMNLFFNIIENAAALFNAFEMYDVAGIEYHHNKKMDSPSGTAKYLASILTRNIARKDKPVYDIMNRKISPHELHFASVRCGSIMGTHKICFDSDADTIELSHTARSRSGFAEGSVLAAEWIKEKTGFFTIDDMMNEMIT